MTAHSARSYALLSIGAAIVTIAIKFGAYTLTGSVSLFSDAAESVVNLLAAAVAFWALGFAARPPDAEHAFGHSKAEYFSSGLESALILVAAASIAVAAWGRLGDPQPLAQLELGLVLSLVAAAVNGAVAWILLGAGRRLRSITLRADAQHLLTDVWTSVGIIVGLVLVKLTGWLILDPLIALLVALNIVWTGIGLMRETLSGLLDASLPAAEQQIIADVLATYQEQGIAFHAIRTRAAGSRRFVSFHMLVPGSWTVQQAHDLSDEVELTLAKALPGTNVDTHVEPLEDPASWNDEDLDRVIDTG